MSKPTSGPWKVKPAFVHGYHNSDSVVGADGKVVATTGQAWRRPRNERDANARLIAAAPSLLVELRKTLAWIENLDALGVPLDIAEDGDRKPHIESIRVVLEGLKGIIKPKL